jgi:DNA polymerase V
METMEQFCPDLELYSIDEAFLSLSGFTSRNLTDYGRTIRRTVQRWTGIPVSIGIAETKTLAKLANRIAKRNPDTGGVFDLTACSDRDRLLSRIPVEEVWGIGPSHTRTLRDHGITTGLHLRHADHQWIRKHLGVVGLRLVEELGGRSCLALEDCPPSKQSITCSRSFGTPLTTLVGMKEAVSTYVSRAAEKLRRKGLAATCLTIFLTTNSFKVGPQYSNALTGKFPVATDSTPELIRLTLQGIRQLYREGYEYKKAGVLLTGLVPANHIQADLFDQHDRMRSKRLMVAFDQINDRWGAGTVRYAATGRYRTWTTQFHRRSPAYTTHWDELPLVRAW